LLERRLGEHTLPRGTWVVAAGNFAEDRAQVRQLSSALINRLFIVPIRVDVEEWLAWAEASRIRSEVTFFIRAMPAALQRPVPANPLPFSTPRSWALLAHDLDLAEWAGRLDARERRSLAFGRVSAHDAALFCAVSEDGLSGLLPLPVYLDDPAKLPSTDMGMWFIVSRLRQAVRDGSLVHSSPGEEGRRRVNDLLAVLPDEFRFSAMLDLVEEWASAGASTAMLETLKEVTGL
jgi:hypothetical protein